jgi:hypothetical protein
MTATISEDVQEQVLAVVRKSQEMTLDAIKRAVGTARAAAEKLPAMPAAAKLPARPTLSRLPGVSALPAPETVVSATFDFLERVLAEQRKFAGELVRATTSAHPAAKAGPAGEDTAPAPAAGEGIAPAAE